MAPSFFTNEWKSMLAERYWEMGVMDFTQYIYGTRAEFNEALKGSLLLSLIVLKYDDDEYDMNECINKLWNDERGEVDLDADEPFFNDDLLDFEAYSKVILNWNLRYEKDEFMTMLREKVKQEKRQPSKSDKAYFMKHLKQHPYYDLVCLNNRGDCGGISEDLNGFWRELDEGYDDENDSTDTEYESESECESEEIDLDE